MDVCRKCGKKQYNPSTRKCYGCGVEYRADGTEAPKMPQGYSLDAFGNVRSYEKTEIKDGKLIVSFDYILEPGKTTLRGDHPKLAESPKCLHPERLSCNYGTGFDRCKYMEFINSGGGFGSGGYWTCTAKPKDDVDKTATNYKDSAKPSS